MELKLSLILPYLEEDNEYRSIPPSPFPLPPECRCILTITRHCILYEWFKETTQLGADPGGGSRGPDQIEKNSAFLKKIPGSVPAAGTSCSENVRLCNNIYSTQDCDL